MKYFFIIEWTVAIIKYNLSKWASKNNPSSHFLMFNLKDIQDRKEFINDYVTNM